MPKSSTGGYRWGSLWTSCKSSTEEVPRPCKGHGRPQNCAIVTNAEFLELVPLQVEFRISYALYNAIHNFLDYFYVFVLYLCMDQAQKYLLMKFLSCM